MKNRLVVLLFVLTVFCLSGCNSSPDNTQNVMDNHGNIWKTVKPSEIKNAIELFDEDWMALAVGKSGDMNAMTISWGAMGELWGRPVITVYVSSSRYTHSFMERNDYFTVTAFPQKFRPALMYIGSHSGRDGDKLKAAGLTPVFTDLGNPIFEEANLAIECRIIYSAPFDIARIDKDVAAVYNNGMGVHTMYIGEIVNVWQK